MSYLYSKLPETGVSPHIGTGGFDQPFQRVATIEAKAALSFISVGANDLYAALSSIMLQSLGLVLC